MIEQGECHPPSRVAIRRDKSVALRRDKSLRASRSGVMHLASQLPLHPGMLKLIGSYALAKLLGFGIVGAIVIYLLLSLLT